MGTPIYVTTDNFKIATSNNGGYKSIFSSINPLGTSQLPDINGPLFSQLPAWPVNTLDGILASTLAHVFSISLANRPSMALEGPLQAPANGIMAIVNSLITSGWTLVGGTYAAGIINMPLYTGQTILFCNTNYPGVGTGIVSAPNLGALATALNSLWSNIYNFSPIINPATGFPALGIQAVLPGPSTNQPKVLLPVGLAFGYFGGPSFSACYGGGYRLSSLPSSPILSEGFPGTTLNVSVTEDINGQIVLAFDIGLKAVPSYSLFTASLGPGTVVPAGVVPGGTVQPQFTIISNGYQFAIVDDANPGDFPGQFNYGGNSIFACVPYINSPIIGLLSSAFVVGPGMFKNQMTWNSGGLCSFAIDGDFVTLQGLFTSANGLATFIYPYNFPVQTSNKKPLTINPYVLGSSAPAIESQVIGQIWDGQIITQAGYPVGSESNINTLNSHLVSQQNIAEPCSLWLTYGN